MMTDFPERGTPYPEVRRMLKEIRGESMMDAAGMRRLFMGLYRLEGLADLKGLARDTMADFMESVPDAGTEAGVRRMEDEVVSMLASLWGSRGGSSGFMTTGGTESNIVALCAARDLAGMKRGSVVMSSTALPYFLKGCLLLGLEPVSVPPREEDFTADVEAMGAAVRKDTVAIVATCGVNPWGTIDPVRDIGRIAEERSLYFHVDAAYGGLLCPWLRDAGYAIPEFGFGVRAVSSVSADPHKTGFSIYPGGSIVFRDEETARPARWQIPTASYDSLGTGIIGTRPGFSIAVTWALFRYLGREGYARLARRCMEITERFHDGVRRIEGLSVATRPLINIGHAISTGLDLDSVRRFMREERGWRFVDHRARAGSREDAIWLCMYPYQGRLIRPFLADLEEAASRAGRPGRRDGRAPPPT